MGSDTMLIWTLRVGVAILVIGIFYILFGQDLVRWMLRRAKERREPK